MNPMKEAWALLKGNPNYQVNQQGTNRAGAGGTMPQQFMRRPGALAHEGMYNEQRPADNIMPITDLDGGHSRRIRSLKPHEFQRQNHPAVGQERSFQSLQQMPGQEESQISRPPKAGFLQRMRDKKQKRLAERAEETGAGPDYRAAYPIDASQGSVFDTQ